MSDLLDQVTDDQDPIKRIASKIPGFGGYIERQNRRAADKLLREQIAETFTVLWKRIGNVQQDMASDGQIMYLDDMEKAATKIQTFVDKIQNAAYGYSSFFDAVKINEEELGQIYEFDLALLGMSTEVASAIDNVEASIGSDGLPAAIRHLVTLSRDLVETYGKRDDVITSIG